MKAYAIFRNGEVKASGLYETIKGAKLGIKWACDKAIKYDSRYYKSKAEDRKDIYSQLFEEYKSQFRIKELIEGDFVE